MITRKFSCPAFPQSTLNYLLGFGPAEKAGPKSDAAKKYSFSFEGLSLLVPLVILSTWVIHIEHPLKENHVIASVSGLDCVAL